MKKSHQEPSKKSQDPFKHAKTISSLVSKLLHRSPNEEFVSEALHHFQSSGILDEENIVESMSNFAECRISEEQFKLDICNQVYEGFAGRVFKMPPDASSDEENTT